MSKLYCHELFLSGEEDISPDEKMFKCNNCKKVFYKKYEAKETFFHQAGKVWIPMNRYNGRPDYEYTFVDKVKKHEIYSIKCPLCKSNKNIESHIDESTPLLLNGIVKLKNGKSIKIK
jgi:hypothetical protein